MAETLAREIQAQTQKECRSLVLGHLQRGGMPTGYDRRSLRQDLEARPFVLQPMAAGDTWLRCSLQALTPSPLKKLCASPNVSIWAAT